MFPAEITIKTKTIAMIALSPLGAFSMGVLATLIVRGWPTDNTAAWLQAFGGIAAVFAAFHIGNKQTKDAVAARDERHEVIFQLVCSVTERAAGVSSHLFQSFNDILSGDIALKTEIITAVEEQLMALKGINPVELPLPAMVEPFLVIRGCLEQSIVFARLLSDQNATDVMRCAYVFSTNSQAISIAARKLTEMQLTRKA